MPTPLPRGTRSSGIVLVAVAVVVLGWANGASALGGEPEVPGFLGRISGRERVEGSRPKEVRLLADTSDRRDSLDLELMAKWCLNYLSGSITVETNFASSYGNWPLNLSPYAVGGDRIAIGDSEVRNALAFPLMREMSGLRDAADIQKGLRNRILGYQRSCGLFDPPTHGDTDVLWATAWMARALIEEHVTTGDREALTQAGLALRGIREHAVKSDGQGLLRLDPPQELTSDGHVLHFGYRSALDFCVVEPFVRYYEVSGDRDMLETAKGLVDGRLANFGTGHDTGHTHSHWHGLLGIAHLGAVTGEARYTDYIEAQLQRWSGMRTDYGWFEATSGYGASETCAVADLLHVWAYLARAGRSSYYDLIERTLRNYLPQEQFFLNDARFVDQWRKQNYPDRAAHWALMKRLEGGFLCRTTPSDRWAENTVSLEGCCPPTGMTGLHLGWKEIVRSTPQGVWVNMSFNHESPEARVVSFAPDLGRVTVVAKQEGKFHLRVPGFVPKDQVVAWRDGRRITNPVWTGDYVTFASARKGEELTLTYPLVRFDQTMTRAGRDLTIHWKGNAVTGLVPRTETWPLFEQIPYPIPPYRGEAARPIPGAAGAVRN